MVYYTGRYKTFRCPCWDVDVQIFGKYYLSETNPTVGRFVVASCPIKTKDKKAKYDQYYKYPACFYKGDCPHLKDFQSEIDFKK
ncbi:MAG: hypothetical protein ACK5L6_03795 [Anaerorhabdus sp.]|uniref:hypothetical protein n=1 Tax=Anaerorhabdus sp. TaxID=1872524 RepID=UPI003A8A71D2